MALPAGTGSTAPEWLMWIPAGQHRITASKRGKPITLNVLVDQQTALVMEETRQECVRAGKQRPFLDFDHERKAASAWVQEFAWRDKPDPGVWVRVEWSELGRQAIEGRAYRSFSPSFFETSGDPARIEGAPLCMGSLLNDPAFDAMAPIWSGKANSESSEQSVTTDQSMNPNATEAAALQARVAELEQKNAELKAAAESKEQEEAVNAAKAENEQLKAELGKLKEAMEARNRRDADAIVASAVSRGVIAVKDEAEQKKWRDLIIADASHADRLAKLPGRVALDGGKVTQRSQVQIIKPDINDAIRGYQQAKTPVDAGNIYHKEFRPILESGDRIPFERYPVDANNVLGSVAGNLIAQRILDLMVSRRPMLRGVVTDFSDQQARKGQSVYTRTVGIPTVNDFGSGAGDTADTDYPVTLSNHKEVHYAFTAAEYLSTNRNLVEERAQAMAFGLGNHMVDAVAALITDAFTSETTGAASTKRFADVALAAQKLNEAGAPDMNRTMWINSAWATELSKEEIALYKNFGGDQKTAYGHWTNTKGFGDIWEFPGLPGNSVNLIGFAFHRNALLIAARVADNPERLVGAGYAGALQVVTDPVTGLSVLSDRWITQATRAVNTRLDVLYGVARGVVAAGHKFVTS